MNKQQQEAMARIDGIDVTKERWIEDPMQMMCGGIGLKDLWPDYDSDNNIDRMVRGLSWLELAEYQKHLAIICHSSVGSPLLLRAEAAQKREALLKAHGVWEENDG